MASLETSAATNGNLEMKAFKKPYKLYRKVSFYKGELHLRSTSWYDENLGICSGWRLYNKGLR